GLPHPPSPKRSSDPSILSPVPNPSRLWSIPPPPPHLIRRRSTSPCPCPHLPPSPWPSTPPGSTLPRTAPQSSTLSAGPRSPRLQGYEAPRLLGSLTCAHRCPIGQIPSLCVRWCFVPPAWPAW
ncbi:H(+)-ATPase 5, partial [Zea mays]